jgi:hypothetical protein
MARLVVTLIRPIHSILCGFSTFTRPKPARSVGAAHYSKEYRYLVTRSVLSRSSSLHGVQEQSTVAVQQNLLINRWTHSTFGYTIGNNTGIIFCQFLSSFHHSTYPAAVSCHDATAVKSSQIVRHSCSRSVCSESTYMRKNRHQRVNPLQAPMCCLLPTSSRLIENSHLSSTHGGFGSCMQVRYKGKCKQRKMFGKKKVLDLPEYKHEFRCRRRAFQHNVSFYLENDPKWKEMMLSMLSQHEKKLSVNINSIPSPSTDNDTTEQEKLDALNESISSFIREYKDVEEPSSPPPSPLIPTKLDEAMNILVILSLHHEQVAKKGRNIRFYKVRSRTIIRDVAESAKHVRHCEVIRDQCRNDLLQARQSLAALPPLPTTLPATDDSSINHDTTQLSSTTVNGSQNEFFSSFFNRFQQSTEAAVIANNEDDAVVDNELRLLRKQHRQAHNRIQRLHRALKHSQAEFEKAQSKRKELDQFRAKLRTPYSQLEQERITAGVDEAMVMVCEEIVAYIRKRQSKLV